jgi:hypothetical protein
MTAFNPGDVVVHKCMLSGAAGSADVSRRVKKISIFENILKPYTTIELFIVDSTDLLNHNIGIDGVNNTVDVSFSQPGQEPYKRKFVITSAEKAKSASNLRITTYNLVGFSPHMVKFPKVQRAYRYQTATDIATDLINTYLSPDKPLIVGDPSRGILGNDHMPHNINGLQIHKAIRSVLGRAASSATDSSLYTFFEDNQNMVIDTLDNLLKKMSPVAEYFQRPMGEAWPLDMARQNFIILALKEHSRVDFTTQVQSIDSKVQPFDLFGAQMGEAQRGAGIKAPMYINLAYNLLRPPTHMAETMPQKAKRAGEFDTQSLTIQVALNPALTVGKGFGVETIAPAGDTNTPVRDKISGVLLATEVRHTADLSKERMQGMTTVKGTKGSYP